MAIFLFLLVGLNLLCSSGGEESVDHKNVYLELSTPVILGDLLSLTCIAENFTQPVQVKWTRLSKSVNITSDHHDVDLRDSDRFLFSASQSNVSKQIFTADLPTSRYLDGGNYSCSVDLNSTIFTDDILVDVLGEPEIDKTLPTKDVILGHTIHIDCHFQAQPEPSNITWYGPANQILKNDTQSHKYILGGEHSGWEGVTFLVISKFTKQDVGQYKCRVQNSLGFDDRVIHLKANPFVQLVPNNSSSIVDYWTVTSYKCMAVNFPSGADIEISWYMRTEFGSPMKLHDFTYKEGCELKITSWLEAPAEPAFGSRKFSELTVTNVTYMFDGKLVCSTTWDGEIYDTSVNISVTGEPEIRTSGTVDVPLGEFTEIVCNVTSRPPPFQVNWFFNNTRMDFYSRNHGIRNSVLGVMIQSRLTIFRVIPDNFGVYTCQAENDYGVQSSIINLREQADCRRKPCGANRECRDGTECVCKPGYRTAGDLGCIDVDECSGHHGCDQDCKDTPGSFLCACFAGYTLAEDGKMCKEFHPLDPTMVRSLLVGVGMGVSIVVLVGVAIILCVYYRRRLELKKQLINTENDSVFGSVTYATHERQLSETDGYATVERPSDEFPRDRLRFLEPLGNGTFGAVFKAEALSITGTGTWELVAVKLCRECATDMDKEDLYNELRIVKTIPGHVNVVSFYGCCTVGDPLLLIMEYVSGGNLLEHLRNRRPENIDSRVYENELTAKDLLSFALQAARGMAHLAHNNIVHRDVAARNILIGVHQICKISDFGLARNVEGIEIYERTSKGPLPIRWMAPESLTEGIHSHKSDVWSYGVLLWEIVTLGASPYADQCLKYVTEAVIGGQTLHRPQHCTAELYDLMCLCWFKHPVNRPDFSSVCENLECLLEREADYIQLDQFQEHIYTVLEPDTMEERV